jgi:head-tail adaptor
MIKTKAEVVKVLGRVYREKITLQQPIKTPDGRGGFVSSWSEGIEVKFYSRTPKTSTTEEAGAVVSIMVHEFKIQDRPGVPPVERGWRVLDGTKTLPVEHVYPDDYDRTLVLVCREVVK